MTEKILMTCLTFIVSGTLGYCVNKIKGYKQKDETQGEAIKCLLRANIVNQYYVYKKMGEIPFYVKESLHKEFEAYKGLKGNSFVEEIMNEIDTWKVV